MQKRTSIDMDKELRTIGMARVPLSLGRTYLNIPRGDHIICNVNLIDAIKYIGCNYGYGSESNLKKGIRFIYNNVSGCSKRQIKLTLRSIKNDMLHNHNEEAYIFRCSREYYIAIYKLVLESSKSFLNEKRIHNSDSLVSDVKKGLLYVSQNGNNTADSKDALKIYHGIIDLDKA